MLLMKSLYWASLYQYCNARASIGRSVALLCVDSVLLLPKKDPPTNLKLMRQYLKGSNRLVRGSPLRWACQNWADSAG